MKVCGRTIPFSLLCHLPRHPLRACVSPLVDVEHAGWLRVRGLILGRFNNCLNRSHRRKEKCFLGPHHLLLGARRSLLGRFRPARPPTTRRSSWVPLAAARALSPSGWSPSLAWRCAILPISFLQSTFFFLIHLSIALTFGFAMGYFAGHFHWRFDS